MNALVTGSNDLISRQIGEIRSNAGANVETLSLDKEVVHLRAEHIYDDLTDFELCKNVTKGMDHVF